MILFKNEIAIFIFGTTLFILGVNSLARLYLNRDI